MKTLLVLILLSPICSYSQSYLGQTKRYIINKFSDWKIDSNNESEIKFSAGISELWFGFNEEGLCISEVWNCNEQQKNQLIAAYIESGYQSKVINGTIGLIVELVNDKYYVQMLDPKDSENFIFIVKYLKDKDE